MEGSYCTSGFVGFSSSANNLLLHVMPFPCELISRILLCYCVVRIRRYNNSPFRRYNNSPFRRYNNSPFRRYNNSPFRRYNNSPFRRYNDSPFWRYNNSPFNTCLTKWPPLLVALTQWSKRNLLPFLTYLVWLGSTNYVWFTKCSQ